MPRKVSRRKFLFAGVGCVAVASISYLTKDYWSPLIQGLTSISVGAFNLGDYTNIITMISAIGIVIAAVAALFVALYNYRYRPILMRSFEIHTKEVKKLLDRWIEQLVEVTPKPTGEVPFNIVLLKPNSPILAVEREHLFSDLSEHDSFNVLSDWNEYKKRLCHYNKHLSDFLNTVHQEVVKQTGLKLDTNLKHGFTMEFIRAVYENFFADQRGGTQKWKDSISRIEKMEQGTLLRVNGYGMARGSPLKIKKVEKAYINLISDIYNTVGDKKYDEWKQCKIGLILEDRDLNDRLRKFQTKINDFKSISLMTEKCKYITGKF